MVTDYYRFQTKQKNATIDIVNMTYLRLGF